MAAMPTAAPYCTEVVLLSGLMWVDYRSCLAGTFPTSLLSGETAEGEHLTLNSHVPEAPLVSVYFLENDMTSRPS